MAKIAEGLARKMMRPSLETGILVFKLTETSAILNQSITILAESSDFLKPVNFFNQVFSYR